MTEQNRTERLSDSPDPYYHPFYAPLMVTTCNDGNHVTMIQEEESETQEHADLSIVYAKEILSTLQVVHQATW